MSLAEESLQQNSTRLWALRAVTALALIALVVGLTMALKKWVSAPDAHKRQTAKVMLLPDTPPPPPPPPKVEDIKPAPKDEPRPAPEDQPKPKDAPPPADAPIKMEGAAGDGPSAFQAGSVSKDYTGGAITTGAASSPSGTPVDRAQERFYANSVRQMLRDEIEKHLRPEAGELTATFAIWVETDGRIRRYEVVPSGDAGRDQDMQGALGSAQRGLRLPAPGALAQPMRFRITVRPQA